MQVQHIKILTTIQTPGTASSRNPYFYKLPVRDDVKKVVVLGGAQHKVEDFFLKSPDMEK